VVDTLTGLTDPCGVTANGTYVAVAQSEVGGPVLVLNESDGSVAATITAVADTTSGDDLYEPQNVAFGPNGDLYIADTYNDRILEYSLSS